MATKIVTKNSSTASAVPTASDLVQGELAVNVADKRLFTEDNAGAIVELGTNPSGNVTFQDNGKAIFGASGDLQIYHDGSNSYIKDLGTGDLLLSGNAGVQIQSDAGENMITTAANGAVSLFYDASAKLATTSTGIDVTGTATMDGLVVDGTNGAYTISSNGNDFYYGRNGANYHIAGTANGAFNFLTGASSANRLKIASNGDISFYEDTGTTPKLFWDASAESLGIGTSSPSYPFHVTGSGDTVAAVTAGASSIAALNLGNSTNPADGGIRYDNGADALIFRASNTERARLDSSGRVGIGRTPSISNSKLEVGGADNVSLINVEASGVTGGMGIGSTGLQFFHGSSAKMRIDSSGNLLVGKTASNSTVSGSQLNSNGLIIGTTSATNPLLLNRLSTDGGIIELQKDGTTVGSIGTGYGVVDIKGGSAGLLMGNTAVLPVNGSGTLTTDSYDIGAGSFRFKDLYLSGHANFATAYASTGIYLGAYATPNLLDDYEEGTWTPTGFSGGTLYNARYTKVGRLVTASAYVNGTTFTSSSMGGLPFTSEQGWSAGTLGLNNSTNLNNCEVASSSTVIQFRQGATSVVPNGSGLMVSVTYHAA